MVLTSSEAAGLLAVHPSTVKRWCNEGELPFEVTDGGHRRIRIDEAMSFAQSHGLHTILSPFRPYEAHVWRALRAAERGGDFGPLHQLALQWVRRGELERLEQLYRTVGERAEIPFDQFCDEAIRGLMTHVGFEWEAGRLRVGDEHMISEVMRSALAALRRSWLDEQEIDPTDLTRPVAVVGAVEGNHHTLGAFCVRVRLERAGWRVFYTGSDVPIEDFGILQKSRGASLVCIAHAPGSSAGDLVRTLTLLREFYDLSRPYALAIGGVALEGDIDASPFLDVKTFRSISEVGTAIDAGFGQLVEVR